MARPIRIQYPGAVYHIISRGNAGQKIFKDTKDYQNFLIVFSDVLERYNIISYAYCLMPNHYHLLIETPDPNLSIAMRQLNGKYTQKFNIRHKRFGHLFQGRYKSILVDMESYRYEIIRYIALNPVRAKMVKNPSQWRWSSHNEMTSKANKETKCLDREKTLKLFGHSKKEAKDNYLKNLDMKMENDILLNELKNRGILGSAEFIDKIKGYFRKQSEVREIPKIERFAHRPKLKDIFQEKTDKKTRNSLLHKAHIEYGYTLSEISREVGLHYATISRIINGRYKYKR